MKTGRASEISEVLQTQVARWNLEEDASTGNVITDRHCWSWAWRCEEFIYQMGGGPAAAHNQKQQQNVSLECPTPKVGCFVRCTGAEREFSYSRASRRSFL